MGSRSPIDTPKTIAVFCGSRLGSSPKFAEAARALAVQLHSQRWNLVYGGGRAGIMGEISRTLVSLAGPDTVQGIIPEHLVEAERQQNPASEDFDRDKSYGHLRIVKDIHTRKKQMADAADAFVVLPGGFGTMEEAMEMITWNQIDLQNKPIVLLNVDGFYDEVFRWIEKATDTEFITKEKACIALQAKTASEAIGMIAEWFGLRHLN